MMGGLTHWEWRRYGDDNTKPLPLGACIRFWCAREGRRVVGMVDVGGTALIRGRWEDRKTVMLRPGQLIEVEVMLT